MKHQQRVDFSKVSIDGGFWKAKQDMVAGISLMAVYARFAETGRFEALKLKGVEGQPDTPHIFWDSDTAKWIESAAYVLQKRPNPELERLVDSLVDDMVESQMPDGYFQSHFQTVEPENRWTRRQDHELYCAGHLMEAAVAYYEATGKDAFLKMVCRMADHIERVFVREGSAKFHSPGHEEIELALVRLYHCTGERRYLELAEYFVNVRGTAKDHDSSYAWCNPRYYQAHLPVREQTTAEGHAVRAVYLYNAMARLALEPGDERLCSAAKKIFNNIADRRMYITGGIGSSSVGEAFTVDYHLPNLTAYAESCAALGLALFAQQMAQIDEDARYADVAERAMYNGFLSSVSLDGKAFFYENPLEIDPMLHHKDVSVDENKERFPIMQRKEVFECSCCPPNITRFIASIGNFLYTHERGMVYVHQYMESSARFETEAGPVSLVQRTAYPYDGAVAIDVQGVRELALRIPGWCGEWSAMVDGNAVQPQCRRGYALLALDGGSHTVELTLAMPVCLVAANPKVQQDAGRVAVMRGPLVYCLEGVDNGAYLRDIRVDRAADWSIGWENGLGVQALSCTGWRRRLDPAAPLYAPLQDDLEPASLKWIPYFAFANRGETEMIVWVQVR